MSWLSRCPDYSRSAYVLEDYLNWVCGSCAGVHITSYTTLPFQVGCPWIKYSCERCSESNWFKVCTLRSHWLNPHVIICNNQPEIDGRLTSYFAVLICWYNFFWSSSQNGGYPTSKMYNITPNTTHYNYMLWIMWSSPHAHTSIALPYFSLLTTSGDRYPGVPA